MANRIKSISKYNGTAWGTETPIGADAANVDLATSYSATTATDANNATVETAMAAVQTDTTNLKKAGHGNGTVTNYDSTSGETSKVLTTDCVVAASDDTATAWSKFNRFRRRVSNKFADYFLKSNLVTSSTGVTTTGADTTVYTTKAINQYLANVVGYTNSTAPDAGNIAEQLESLNDNMIIRDEITITKTAAEQASSWTFTDPADQTWLCQLKSGQSEITWYGSQWNGPYRIAKIVPSAGSASDWTIASNQLRATSTATISYPYSVDITLVNSSSTPVTVKEKTKELSDELQYTTNQTVSWMFGTFYFYRHGPVVTVGHWPTSVNVTGLNKYTYANVIPTKFRPITTIRITADDWSHGGNYALIEFASDGTMGVRSVQTQSNCQFHMSATYLTNN